VSAPALISVHRPKDLKSLQEIVARTEPPHYFLAGGTDLLVQHKDGFIPPSTWLDVTGLAELGGIVHDGDEIWLGALATHEELVRSRIVRRYAPALVDACRVIGGPQIRWRGTLGGNLANASPAADTVPALFTLEARVEILGSDGARRQVPIDALASAPRKSVLENGELITGVRFPVRDGARGGFQRLGQRRAQAISKVSVAVTAVLDGTTFTYVAIACGSVAPTVVRAPRAEAILREGGFTADAIEEAGREVSNEVRPIDDLRSTEKYRRAMAGVLLRRALSRLRLR